MLPSLETRQKFFGFRKILKIQQSGQNFDLDSVAAARLMDSAYQALRVFEANSRHGGECVKSDRIVAGGTFDAMKMQSVPVCKAFHEGYSAGSNWQMPSMQTYRVQTHSVRNSLMA
jgi:hypothetical protein